MAVVLVGLTALFYTKMVTAAAASAKNESAEHEDGYCHNIFFLTFSLFFFL